MMGHQVGVWCICFFFFFFCWAPCWEDFGENIYLDRNSSQNFEPLDPG